MATNRLAEEGIFSSLRERYGNIDNALAAHAEGWAGVGAEASIADGSSLREALAGPQHDQIIAILIGLAKAPPVDGEALPIHAEKNQDNEDQNDQTPVAGSRVRFMTGQLAEAPLLGNAIGKAPGIHCDGSQPAEEVLVVCAASEKNHSPRR